ncbi:hypothetical protein [Clostridium thermopalmarium]|uniref:Uncharacterized protein n=1 Tax=Clostridium thermopalmarium DSM 5974 TaxID=1121340 RepID=A0A2T0API4_9CLOT|nr:hypothetical protein [Clostridium thermopalmarium]PRR70932.1 hypothetical protein CPAL_20220 [Clostridium thermopalmarium DSM 5974]PVZ28856.1 hypothetical protein LX19_00160 [Clostridium thermopalmarium DSM 5974]
MKTTANYGLKKPEGTDVVNIEDLNYNADIIDTQIKSLNDKKIDYGTASGTNTYTVTITGATLTEGRSYKIKFTNANTGAATLNINGLGAKSILKSNGNALSSGNIKAGQILHLVYTGSVFQLLGEGGEYGTATADKVLEGYTIGTENGIVSGTMPNNSGKIQEAVATYSEEGFVRLRPPKGYYDGAQGSSVDWTDENFKKENIKPGVTIFGQTGTFTSDANATAGQILSGQTAYVKGNKVTGTMPNNGSKTFTPSDSVQTSGAGYYSGITVNARPSLSGNATTAQVLSGQTFYGNNYTRQTGTMPNNGAKIIIPSTTNQAIPAGYHNGSGYVKGDANLKPENIKNGVSIFGVTGTLEPRPSSVHTRTVSTTHSSSRGVQNLTQTFISAPNANYILFISDLDADNRPYSYVANNAHGAPQSSIGFCDGTKYFDFYDDYGGFGDSYSSMDTKIRSFSVYIDKANNKAYTLLIYSQYMSNYEDSNLHAFSIKQRILDITGLNHNSLSIVSLLGSQDEYNSSSSAKLDGTFYYFS